MKEIISTTRRKGVKKKRSSTQSITSTPSNQLVCCIQKCNNSLSKYKRKYTSLKLPFRLKPNFIQKNWVQICGSCYRTDYNQRTQQKNQINTSSLLSTLNQVPQDEGSENDAEDLSGTTSKNTHTTTNSYHPIDTLHLDEEEISEHEIVESEVVSISVDYSGKWKISYSSEEDEEEATDEESSTMGNLLRKSFMVPFLRQFPNTKNTAIVVDSIISSNLMNPISLNDDIDLNEISVPIYSVSNNNNNNNNNNKISHESDLGNNSVPSFAEANLDIPEEEEGTNDMNAIADDNRSMNTSMESNNVETVEGIDLNILDTTSSIENTSAPTNCIVTENRQVENIKSVTTTVQETEIIATQKYIIIEEEEEELNPSISVQTTNTQVISSTEEMNNLVQEIHHRCCICTNIIETKIGLIPSSKLFKKYTSNSFVCWKCYIKALITKKNNTVVIDE